jgi:hypothetical protein
VDGVVPTVTGVSSSSANGYYRAGDLISIQVSFSEAVTVTGTPTLTLETGSSDAVVNYVSGDGTTSLTFEYTVLTGHVSSDLDCRNASALAGAIKDANGNSATLTLPVGATAGSLAASGALVVDAVTPTVSNVTSTTPNGTYKAGQQVSIQVNFSEAVSVTGTPTLTLETGTNDAVISYASGSGTSSLVFTYTIATGETSSHLDCKAQDALSLQGGTISDVAGNNATLTLPVGSGTANSLANNKALVIDTTSPQVTNVTSSTANGSYRASQSVSIQVTFSEAVTVTGTPQLTLETGASDAVVNYTSGSGGATLTFSYTISAGHNAADLDYVTTSALSLLSGTIRDAATNDAILTLPTPGSLGSLSANKNLGIDTTPPTATLSSTYPSPTSNYPIPLSITFSESVTGLSTSDLTITNGFAYNLVGSGSSYTVDVMPTTNGPVEATLTASSVTDTAGNANTVSSPLSIDFQTLAPRLTSVTTTTQNGSYREGQTISIKVNFSSAVDVTGTPQITLETGVSDAVVTYSGGSGTEVLTFDYTIQAGHTSSDLDYRAYTTTSAFSLNGGTIKDSATGTYDAALLLPVPGTTGSLGAAAAIVVDTTAPTVTSVNSSTTNGSYRAGQSISIQVNFSEVVTVTNTPTLTLETGSSDAVASYVSGSGSSSLTFSYTVAAGHTSSDLDCVSANALSLNGGTITDAAGNNAVQTVAVGSGTANSLANNKAIVIDTTPPTVSNVTASNVNGSYKAGTVIGVQVVFSETVVVAGSSGAAASIALLTGGTTTVNFTSGSNSSTLLFNYTVANGDSSLDLAYSATSALTSGGRTIRDAAGNDAVLTLATPGTSGSLDFNKNIVIDTTAPTVMSSSSSTADGTYKVGDPTIPITVTFSEAVTVSGTPQLQLDVGGTTYATYSSGSGSSTLTFNYTIAAGNNSSDLDYSSASALGLNGGTIRDTALNDATLTLPTPGASDSLSNAKNIVIDTTAPTVVSVSSSTADGYYTVGEIIEIIATFDSEILVTGVPNLTLETGAIDGVASYVSGSRTTSLTFRYTIGAGENSSDLEVQNANALSANGGTLQDSVGNTAILTLSPPTFSSSRSIVIDTTAPTVGISVIEPSITNASLLRYTVTFSEVVSGFTVEDLSINNGTPSDFTPVTGTTYTFSLTPQEEGVVEVSVEENVAHDSALNFNAASSVIGVTYDSTKPTIALSSSAPARTNGSPIPVSIECSESITGLTVEDISVTNGTAINLSGSGSSYTLELIPDDDGVVQLSVDADAGSDLAGNATEASATLSRVFDTTSPTVQLTTAVGGRTNQSSIPVTITFSETASGFTIDDLTLVNAAATNFTVVSGTTYTVNITPSEEGEVQISVNAGKAIDLAGNQNTASDSLSVAYDVTSPSVTLVSSAPATTQSSPIPVEFTFSEPVSNFIVSDITVTNGTASNLTGSGTIYSVDIIPDGDGVVEVSLSSAVVTDVAGNGNQPSSTLSRTFDATGATSTLSTVFGQYTNQSAFSVTITFNESVSGLAPGDFVVVNGSASTVSGSGASYTVEIAPITEGNVVISLPAGTTVDALGNQSLASNQLSVMYDTTSPATTVSSSATSPTRTSPIPFTITFTELPLGFTSSDVTVVQGSIASFTGSGLTRDIAVVPTGQGDVGVSVTAGVATDAAGNGNSASNTLTLRYDSVSPQSPTISSPTESAVLTTNQPVISGTAEAGATITVREGESEICSATVSDSGEWSCVPLSPLAEGRHALWALAVDTAANESLASPTRNLVIDAVRLAAPVLASAVGDLTSDTTPTAYGSGPAGKIIHVREGETLKCTATIAQNGLWRCDISELSTGQRNLVAWAQDSDDDTVSDDVPFTIHVGVSYRGIVTMANRSGTPLEDVDVSYQSRSTVTDTSGGFGLPMPDEPGVHPTLFKRGWSISLMSTQSTSDGVWRYSAVPSLEAKSYAIWDLPSKGFTHALRLMNRGEASLDLSWSIVGPEGELCRASPTQTLTSLNDLRARIPVSACSEPRTHGFIEVEGVAGQYDGEFESSIPGSGDVALRTSTVQALSNPIQGSSFVLLDTASAVLNTERDLQFSENVLLISNVSDESNSFRIRHFSGRGSTLMTATVRVPARSTLRRAFGTPDQRAPLRGLIEITPTKGTLDYVATMRRYGYTLTFNEADSAFAKSDRFFVMSENARVGATGELVIRNQYDRDTDAYSSLELANTSNSRILITITHVGREIRKVPPATDDQGEPGRAAPIRWRSRKTTIPIRLPSRGSTRVPFSRFIRDSKEGVLTIRSDSPYSVIANVVSHLYTSNDYLSASSLIAMSEVFGDDHYGFYDSMLTKALWLSNTSASKRAATVACLSKGQPLNIIPLTLAPGASASAKLSTCFGNAASGIIHVNSSAPGGFVADRVRFRSSKGLRTRVRAR